jgi:hypothetical protein
MVVLRFRGVVIASQRLLLATRFDTCSSHPAYLPRSDSETVGFLTRKLLGFDLGLIRAMDRNEMREIAQLHDLNQSICLDNVIRGLRIGQTHRPCIDNLAITFTPAATQIGWDGESL